MSHLIAGTDRDNVTRELAVDFVTNALESISTDHANIHEGNLFTSFTKFNLGAGATRKITFQTPTTKYIHFRPALVSTSADKVTVDLYETSSGNSGGSPLTATNRNRISTKTATSTVKDAETVTTNGTAIDQYYVGGGTGNGQSSAGSTLSAEDELILKRNTLYTIVITNGSSSAQDIQIKLKWYEELSGV